VPLEWWPIFGFGAGFILPLLTPNFRALGACLVGVGILLTAAFVVVEGQVRHANNGLVVAVALTPILTAACGLVLGTLLRTGILLIGRL
jgi:hypothetical protein